MTYSNDELISLILNGNIKEAEEAINGGSDVNNKDAYDNCPLIAAAQKGYSNLVRLLIEKGANVNEKFRENKTPLYWAIQEGHVDTVQVLIQNSAKIDIIDKDNRSPFSLSIEQWNSDIIKLMLPLNPDLNIHLTNNSTPLYQAIANKDIEMVKLFIQHGADVNFQDGRGYTPIVHVAECGYIEIAEYLLNEGADVNKKSKGIKGMGDFSPLYQAVYKGHVEMVELLIRYGANVNLGFGKTFPLDAARELQHYKIIKMLLNNGASSGPKNYIGKFYTLLHNAAQNHFQRNFEVMKKNDSVKYSLYFLAALLMIGFYSGFFTSYVIIEDAFNRSKPLTASLMIVKSCFYIFTIHFIFFMKCHKAWLLSVIVSVLFFSLYAIHIGIDHYIGFGNLLSQVFGSIGASHNFFFIAMIATIELFLIVCLPCLFLSKYLFIKSKKISLSTAYHSQKIFLVLLWGGFTVLYTRGPFAQYHFHILRLNAELPFYMGLDFALLILLALHLKSLFSLQSTTLNFVIFGMVPSLLIMMTLYNMFLFFNFFVLIPHGVIAGMLWALLLIINIAIYLKLNSPNVPDRKLTVNKQLS